ncbi:PLASMODESMATA CALLOSE-BINDING PROTEIN 3-like [Musa acuminata AAA Group]|uniref:PLASMODESMATA CALLOSE-BINDING PROTEIN 3-like n=1 Tax=Musa acuminata AAA Group TaxID=214697 RepID=UPI0031E25CD2
MAAAFLLLTLALALFGGSDAAWCVCRSDVSTSALQKSLDYACGAGADCSPVLQNGACYNPNTVLAHCSYAVNSYYQRKGQAQGSCDFAAAATLTSTDPGGNGCTYPATPSAAGTSSTPTSTSSTPTSTSTTTPTTFTPNTGTTGSTGGVLGGLGPSGTTSTLDGSHGGMLMRAELSSFLSALLLSSLILVSM